MSSVRLLANIYMHRFLRAWRERGKDHQYQARVINYADDFVILSRGHAAEALAWTRWAMTHLGLTLNETKTCLRTASRDPFDFLGYTFGIQDRRKTGQTYLAAGTVETECATARTRRSGTTPTG